MTAILLATTNKHKVERIRKLLKASGLNIEVKIPTDVGIELIDVEEGSDLIENARAKARAFFGKTELPIMGTDTGFFMEGIALDPAMVKRNALDGRKESEMTQQEVVDLIIGFYKDLALRHGGGVAGFWKDVFVLVLPDGSERTSEGIREVTLTSETRGTINPYMPMTSMYISKITGKYMADGTPEDELEALGPYKEALVALLG